MDDRYLLDFAEKEHFFSANGFHSCTQKPELFTSAPLLFIEFNSEVIMTCYSLTNLI